MTDDDIFDSIEETELLGSEELVDRPESPAATLEAMAAAMSEAKVGIRDEVQPSIAASYSKAQQHRARDLLSRLYAARRALRFYPMEHPATKEAVAAIAETARGFHEEGVDVRLAFYEGEILFGDLLLTEESLIFDQLIRDLAAIGAGSIVIKRGALDQEYERMIEVLTRDARYIDAEGGIQAVAAKMSMPNIDIGPVVAVERLREQEGESSEAAKGAYTGALSLMREIDRLMHENRQVPSAKVKGVVRSLVDNVLNNRYAMLQLTGLRNYDEYTFYHSANVAILSLALGSAITQDYRFLSSLGVGSLLHDIGKLSVDLDILNKPGALSADEWSQVRRHPVSGAQAVMQLPGVDKSAVVTILEHHMRFDGTGYPARTPQRSQHLASRIVAVADSYDAMTSRRSYSAARVQDEAMSMLVKSAGSSLDPGLVRLFVRLLGVYPPRSAVRLVDGRIAVVLHPSPGEPLRPVVRVIAEEDGSFMEPADLDLTEAPEVSIRGCIDTRLLNVDVDDYV